MPRRESKQHELFETGLFLVGGCQPYLRNIGDLARLLPPGEADVARAKSASCANSSSAWSTTGRPGRWYWSTYCRSWQRRKTFSCI